MSEINGLQYETLSRDKEDSNITIFSNADILNLKLNEVSFLNLRSLDEKVYAPAYKSQLQHETVIVKKLLKIDAKRDVSYNLFSLCGFNLQLIKYIYNNLHTKTLLKTILYVMSCMPLPLQKQEYYTNGVKKKIRNDLQRLTDVLKLGLIANLKNVGQGKLASQIGLMIANLSIHLPDTVRQKFLNTLTLHNINKRGTLLISWVLSAIGCGNAARRLVELHFGHLYLIVPFSGMMLNKLVNLTIIKTNDTKADIFMHVRNKLSGIAFIVPVSLKKDGRYRIDNTTLQRVVSKSEEATLRFNNDVFRSGRLLIYRKYLTDPLFSYRNIIKTLILNIENKRVDLKDLEKDGNTKLLYLLYNKSRYMTEKLTSSIGEAKSLLNDGKKDKKPHLDKKLYMSSLDVLGRIYPKARDIRLLIINHSKDFCNNAISYFMEKPDLILDHIRRNFPLKLMYLQGLVQISSLGYVTWLNILLNMNIDTVETFILNLSIRESGDGSFRIVYSFKTLRGMLFIDMFNVEVRLDGIGYKTPKFYISPLPGFEKIINLNIGAI